MSTYYTHMESPLGPILLTSNGTALTMLAMHQQKHGSEIQPDWRRDAAPFAEAVKQLDAYFAGELKDFDLPLAPAGTPFQQSVWQALLTVPFGATASYGEIAQGIGNPKACRAVGLANGQNPIAIIIPCHRIIGSNGKLTGYGGGLNRKEWLLSHEQGITPAELPTDDLFAAITVNA